MTRFVRDAPWTTGLGLVVVLLNLGLVVPWIDPATLEFDRRAVERGEVWRLLTGSLVHWSFGHLVLDLGALLAVGLLCEEGLGRRYAIILAAAFVAVALVVLVAPEVERYRGLSGVDAGQYAAALAAEIRRQWRSSRGTNAAPASRRCAGFALPAAAALLFAVKLAVEWSTGRLVLPTPGLGDLGVPLPLAHLAGVAGALVGAVAADRTTARRRRGARAEERGAERGVGRSLAARPEMIAVESRSHRCRGRIPRSRQESAEAVEAGIDLW
jgi:rhomboid family GlyGly-CTERM serine protease